MITGAKTPIILPDVEIDRLARAYLRKPRFRQLGITFEQFLLGRNRVLMPSQQHARDLADAQCVRPARRQPTKFR